MGDPQITDTVVLTVSLSQEASKPYNPSIANVYYLAGFIESCGRGVEKICQACEEDGSLMPEYNIHPGDIMIMFKSAPGRAIYSLPQTGVNKKVNERVNEKEQALLELLAADPGYTVSQLSEKLSVSRKMIAAHLKTLKEKGLIDRIGSARNGYWQINSLT